MIDSVHIVHLDSPMGIDEREPLVSFSLRNETISADIRGFRVVCLDEESNEVFSALLEKADNSIPITGVDFASYRKYEVVVQALSENGDIIEAESAFFVTADMSHNLGTKAKWITYAETERFRKEILFVTGGLEDKTKESIQGLCHGMYFRKSFYFDKKIKQAYVSVCGLGFYHLYLNGKKIGDRYLDSPQTDYRTGALYSTFDITDLMSEQNVFLASLGNGRHIEAYGYEPAPRLFIYGIVRFEDGSEAYIRTDSSWLCNGGPIKENSIYEGEHYDARDELDGWEDASFDVTGWKKAKETSGYKLRAQMMPPIMVTQSIPPRDIVMKGSGRWIVDFGHNMSGIVELCFNDAPEGTKVLLHFSELLDDEGELLSATARDAATEDWYICKGGKRERFSPSFTYHGFRYAEVVDYPGILDSSNIIARVVHTSLKRIGYFKSTNPLLNRIHDMIQWSQRANVMSIPTDCPQREERMGWLGDVQLVSEQAICNFDMAAFYRKFLNDIELSQLENGALSDVTPPYWSLYPADPSWGGAYATIMWNLYFYYGDKQALCRHIDSLCRYADFLYEQTGGHLLHDFGKYGDWCPPACTYPKQTPLDITSNFFLMRDTKIVSEILSVLDDSRSKMYLDRFNDIKDAFNERFNNHGMYAFNKMSPIDRFGGMTSQVLPLALGIVPKEDEKRAVEILVDIINRRFDFHFDCGIVGIKYILPVLEKYGYSDVAYKLMTRKTYPSFGYMVEMGATTLWERWEFLAGKGMNSHNHVMFGSVDSWFYQYIGGIRPVAPNWSKVVISPSFIEDLEGASVSQETTRGVIRSSWFRRDGKVHLKVAFPLGMQVTVEAFGKSHVYANGGAFEFES